jgi:hypothetical protein
LLMDWDELSNNYRRPSIHASYQVSVHWRKRFQRRICVEIDQWETRIACGGHVFLTYRDEMSIHYRVHSKDASYQMLVHLGKQFQRRRFFRNQPIRNKNCLWWPCLLRDRNDMSFRYRGPSIDASY